MEAKKNPDKDVNRKSGQFFLIGLSISISIMIVAFEWETEYIKLIVEPSPSENPILLAEIPIVKHDTPKPIQEQAAKPKSIVPEFIPVESRSDASPDADSVKAIELDSLAYRTTGMSYVEDEPEEDTTVFIFVADPPTPINGFDKFYKELSSKIKYPAQARRMSVEGKVFVEFIVGKNGESTDLKITKGIGAGCDEEAMRVLTSMKWNPGRQRGKPVRVKMVIPVYFRLN